MKNIDIEKANQALLERWIKEEMLRDPVAEPSNAENLIDLLNEAEETGAPVTILALGCQQFSKVAGDFGSVTTVRPISTRPVDRPARFADGIASLQTGLQSFGINTNLVIIMSDIEALVRASLVTNEQIVSKEHIQPIIQKSIANMRELISRRGGQAIMPLHSELLMQHFDLNNVTEILQTLGIDENRNPEEIIVKMLEELYKADPAIIPEEVDSHLQSHGVASIGTIWFDMMSPLAGEHRVRLHKAIRECNPAMPILALLRNAGKWETAADERRTFVTKAQFVSRILHTQSPTDRKTWLRELMSKPDDELRDFLRSLGIDFSINSSQDKNAAVETIELITFGMSSFHEGRLIQAVAIDPGTTLKSFVKQSTNQAGSHVFELISQGQVFVNGSPENNPQFQPQPGDIIQIGKKIVIRITK